MRDQVKPLSVAWVRATGIEKVMTIQTEKLQEAATRVRILEDLLKARGDEIAKWKALAVKARYAITHSYDNEAMEGAEIAINEMLAKH